MLLDGYRIHNFKSDCYTTNLIIPVMLKLHQDIDIFFISNLLSHLYISCSNENIFQSVIYSKSNNDEDIYKHLTGFYWNLYNCGPLHSGEFIFNELIQNRPVGICINTDNIPWAKYRGMPNHNLLIVGARGNELICVDNYYSDTLQTVSMDLLEQTQYDILCYNIFAPVIVNKKDAFFNILNGIEKQHISSRLHSIGESYNFFINTLPENIIVPDGYDINSSQVIINIHHFLCDRINLSNTLGQLYQEIQLSSLDYLCTLVNKEVEYLEKFKLYMIKLLLQKTKLVHSKCSEILLQITNIEKDITNIIFELSIRGGV